MTRYFYILTLFIFSATNYAQQDSIQAPDYYRSNFLRFENYTYKTNIKSVKLHESTNQLALPLLRLNSEEKLLLSFDELHADMKQYNYTIVHCDAYWKPTDMNPMLYLNGFGDNPIYDYAYSTNAIQKYVHYSAEIPNQNFTITKSGNYLLKVYEGDNKENLIITRRFMVFDSKINIQARCNRPSIISDRDYKQEIDFTVFSDNSYIINNPYADLKVVITQNGRWDNAVYDLKPLFVKENELVYDYDRANVFTGGNEYRYFDLRTLGFKTERTAEIKIDSNQIVHIYLVNDEKRSFKRYSTTQDINGKFIIEKRSGGNEHVESDYAWVHFFMPYNIPESDGNMYVFGELSDWTSKPECKMRYNYEKAGYEAAIYLKQGYYNYEYALMKDGERQADNTLVEGMHFETENEYMIFVYHQSQGAYYDQLIGVKVISSLTGF